VSLVGKEKKVSTPSGGETTGRWFVRRDFPERDVQALSGTHPTRPYAKKVRRLDDVQGRSRTERQESHDFAKIRRSLYEAY
jgi:hypothetical protein